jgi:DNA-binding beta-propeller fold protein YncE
MKKKKMTWLAVCVLAVGAVGCGEGSGDVGEPAVAVADELMAPTFEVDPSWPVIPNNWVLGITSGLAIDGENNIWVLTRPRTVPPEEADRAAPPVMVFDAAGNFIKSWGGPGDGYEWPGTEHGVYVDHDNYVWIAGSGAGDDQILKFTTDGEFVMQIGRANQSGGNTDTLNVNRAADVDVYAPTNELFVADGYGNRRVIVFDAETGAYKRMWGAYGNPPTDPTEDEVLDESRPEQFDNVHGVQVSDDGLVYVADRRNMRFQVFTVDGDYITEVVIGRTEPDPQALAARASEMAHGRPVPDLIREVAVAHRSASRIGFSADPEQRFLYLAERSNQEVVVFDRETLKALAHFGQVGDRPGEFYILHDMVSDPAGNLYTAEVNVGRRAQKFTFTGLAPVSPM